MRPLGPDDLEVAQDESFLLAVEEYVVRTHKLH